jgi:Nup85 Nucleoporin
VGELQYGVALADGGTDCNDFELLALTQILEAHASYHSSNREPSDRAPTPHRGREGAETRFHRIQGLSQQYVDSIRHCVEGWEGAITRRRVEAASENGMVVEGVVDEEDLEILLNLKYMFGLVTMSNAYLRLVSPLSALRRRGGMNPWHYPGLVSADVVRFFRETYPVLKDRQPQEVLFGDGAPMTVDVVDWSLIRSFVLRGLLEPAWLCLQRDPIYITAKQEISHGRINKDRALMRAYQSIVDDTESVGVLLLLAPLPGGRAIHPLDDGQVEQMIEELVEYDSVSSLRPSDSMGWDATGDGYSHQEAYRKHQLWQGEVRDYVQVRKTLEHKRAEFDELLSIMGGNIRDVRFESWAEELCATILYKAPSMTPRQLSDCAAQIAGNSKYWKYDDKSDEAPLQTTDLVPRVVVEGLLSLMSGLVEVGIPLLWKLGGSSGAALPSAIVR